MRPINPDRKELDYRRAQNALGKLQVSLQLAVEVSKTHPELPGLEQSCASLYRAKNEMYKRVFAMEEAE